MWRSKGSAEKDIKFPPAEDFIVAINNQSTVCTYIYICKYEYKVFFLIYLPCSCYFKGCNHVFIKTEKNEFIFEEKNSVSPLLVQHIKVAKAVKLSICMR